MVPYATHSYRCIHPQLRDLLVCAGGEVVGTSYQQVVRYNLPKRRVWSNGQTVSTASFWQLTSLFVRILVHNSLCRRNRFSNSASYPMSSSKAVAFWRVEASMPSYSCGLQTLTVTGPSILQSASQLITVHIYALHLLILYRCHECTCAIM